MLMLCTNKCTRQSVTVVKFYYVSCNFAYRKLNCHSETFHLQVLINQLKEVAPSIQKSISDCTEKVNNISSGLPPMAKHHGRATSPSQAQSSGRALVIIQKMYTSGNCCTSCLLWNPNN